MEAPKGGQIHGHGLTLADAGGRGLTAAEESEEIMRKKREKEMEEAVEATADDVFHNLFLQLTKRRLRVIDFFRKFDTGGRGCCSEDDFCNGLLWMGFEPTDREFQTLMDRLDKHGTGEITLKDFDKAIKHVERKLEDPAITARVASKRVKEAAFAMKVPPDVPLCASCGSAMQDDARVCNRCGQKLQSKTPRKVLGYTPAHATLTEPIDAADEFMLKIVAQMNARKYRSMDFFRTMDRDCSGSVSVDEFHSGLKKIGLRPTKQEFDAIMKHLDQDGGGDVTHSEFDKAAKHVVKKAKQENRHSELETWKFTRGEEIPTAFSWGHRSVRQTNFGMTNGWGTARDNEASMASTMPSGSMSERSNRTIRADGSVDLRPWTNASHGPRGVAWSAVVGSGSLYDNSISFERLFDSACSGAHPTSTKMPKLPLHKTIYPKAYCDGRFENEPTHVPHPKLLIGKDRCLTAARRKHETVSLGGVRTFRNAPGMRSSVYQAGFNRDMDSSVDAVDNDLVQMYDGCAGMASWLRDKSIANRAVTR